MRQFVRVDMLVLVGIKVVMVGLVIRVGIVGMEGGSWQHQNQ